MSTASPPNKQNGVSLAFVDDVCICGSVCLRVVPRFRGVERSVEFLLSPRLGQAYQHLKEHGSNLPLVGRAVFLPSVEAAEGVTRFFLVVVQAPLPSAESVANVAEVRGKIQECAGWA